ncbi:transglutaminase-like cysteine peptidase [Rhodoplanes sp. TEM]|uniref:Transglutaminase-like cysteine peptidase n=1 Tax=Rhodoplanes tepidamans TaxID=200616 RepID=A0ABT5JB75_RHOTP|nr:MULTISPECIES: transglutaminase-like cysteine peptidase [Rhodoplanes]MDC7786727.1 transglutaminase-like cysteine peptidase [Rhodoplanes tepidamans]MDC7983733.1 transglutaminase-like cysteine peptidase [Rhodoplanes sp. TEM]MDQ0358164.1 putative transglutaminase-like cysteine proteinase [Rhodoplanes tepidamans]
MARGVRSVAITAALLASCWSFGAEAAFYGLPRVLKQQTARLQLDEPAAAPMAHTRFCLQYPDQCKVRRMVFRGGPTRLTSERWADLVSVNIEVNRAIRAEPNTLGVAYERWLVAPRAGDCNDYAVTKRHELMKRGWPARNLLLAEVVVPSGEHHLVLVIRTTDGDLVADNLAATIRPLATPRYRWLRAQSPRNPLFWSTVARPSS